MSRPERFKQVRDLAGAALDLPEPERPAFLAQSCAGDETLRAEVVSLLAAHDEAREQGFLETPAAAAFQATLAPGARIGPYRVVDVVGKGGMGIVYRAVRADDEYQQVVALKLMRREMDAALGQRRLREERQILASLEHPGIARLLDGGSTQDGLAYLVMEYVEGEPITHYCERRGPRLRDRLRLFQEVCAAVDYAHRSLVIHRDLKPANVLVTAEGRPKLLDFGIAKLLVAGREAELAQTDTMLPLLTPDYASPEQVRGRPVTTASDVYSLGVVLYEMLTGRRPVTPRTDSLEEIVRAVCETEPRRPSDAVRANEPLRKAASAAELRGDLDTIVMKALRKEPERRYPTARELSEDIRRHLEGLPVRARADTPAYRLSKFVGRHRAAVAATVLVFASLVGGLFTTLRQARIAEEERRRAERRFDDVRKLASFVLFDVHDAITKLPGATPVRKQIVEKALQYLDRLAAEGVGDPVLLAEIARGYERLSEVQGQANWANLGDEAGALASARKATALRERLATARPGDPMVVGRLVASYAKLGGLLDGDEARKVLKQMRSVLDGIPPASANEAWVLEAWIYYHDLDAGITSETKDVKAISERRRRQVEVAERLLSMDPTNLGHQRNVALASKYYGGALHTLGEHKLARERYDRAVELDLAGVAAEPTAPQRKLDLSFSHASVGSLLRDERDLDGALVEYRKALQLRSDVYAADPENEQAFRVLVRAHQSLASVFVRKPDLPATTSHLREVLALQLAWEKKHPSAHGQAGWQAAFHESLGDHVAYIAALPGLPPRRRREHWLRAREEYNLARAGPVANPQKLEQAIAKCDEALAALERRP